jgi:hypothetical protein
MVPWQVNPKCGNNKEPAELQQRREAKMKARRNPNQCKGNGILKA